MRYFYTILGYLAVISAFAVNEDTPNLSFENGDFEGWTLYEGDYYYDVSTDSLKYIWTENLASSRIKIMSTVMGAMDPTIQCAPEGEEFYINPDGVPVVRLGIPNKSEGLFDRTGRTTPRCKQLNAKAERIEYKFKATENTSLLTYKFAFVLADPASQNNAHKGEELPQFIFRIKSINPTTGLEKAVNCGEYAVKVGDTSLELNSKCALSSTNQGNNAQDYKYKNWTTGAIDLSKHIGNEITIEVITHDCLVRISCSGDTIPVAGGHESWGYFWAETKNLSLTTKNCEGENPQLIAPEGFYTYTWTRSDSLNNIFKTIDPQKPWIVEVDKANVIDSLEYQCNLGMEFCATKIKLESLLDNIVVNPDFTTQDSCSGLIKFFDSSSVIGDKIYSYYWDFGDSTYSSLKNPIHTYKEPGIYIVKLIIQSALGCEKYIEKEVKVNYFPKLQIDGKNKFCKGDSIYLDVLEAERGSKFIWNTGDTLQKIAALATESKTFSVKVIDKHGCEYSKSTNVVVYENPTVRIRGTEKVCYGDTAILIAGGAIKYSWNTGATTDTLLVKPLENSVYTLTGYTNNGCPDTCSIMVSVLELPKITIEGADETCQNKTEKLVATGAETYIWNDMFTGKERNIVSDSVGLITYSVVGIDSNKCSNVAKKFITIKAKPVVSLTGDSFVCQGEDAILHASGADSWEWHDKSKSSSYALKINAPVTWSVTGTTDGCSSTESKTIYIKKPSNVWINGKTEICEGDTLKLVASGAKSYNWNNGSKRDSMIAQPTQSTQYQLIATTDNDCKVTKNVDIIVHKNPIIEIIGDNSACENQTIKLRAKVVNGETADFYWSNGAKGDSIELQITKETSISVQGASSNQCRGAASHTITLKSPPTLTYDGDTAICPGETTQIIVKGASTYTWAHGGEGAFLKESPTDNTTYIAKGILGGCISELPIQITIKEKPNVYISGVTQACPGETFTISANGAQSYQWNTGDTTESITKSQNTTTTYTVIGTGANGCSAEGSYMVKLLPLPDIKIETENSIGCPNTLDTVRLTATGGINYRWSSDIVIPEIESYPNSKNLLILVENEAKIYLEGEDENGCINYDEVSITKLPRQTLTYEVDPILIEKSNPVVHLKGNTPVNAEWQWTPNIYEDLVLKGNSVIHNYGHGALPDSMTIAIHSLDAHNCEYKESVTIYVWKDVWAPTGFTPNADENNDLFRFYGGQFIDEFSFIIYNRLGQIVFEGDSLEDQWDGTYKDEPCPLGVYGWVAHYKSNYKNYNKEGELRGYVTLMK